MKEEITTNKMSIVIIKPIQQQYIQNKSKFWNAKNWCIKTLLSFYLSLHRDFKIFSAAICISDKHDGATETTAYGHCGTTKFIAR